MKTLLIVSLLLLVLLTTQSPCVAQGGSDLSVISFSWSRYISALNDEPKWDDALLPSRQQQINDREKAMVKDNYGDLLRSKDLKKVERDAARSAVKEGSIFTYKVKVQNTGTKTIKNLYWEYQIIDSANPENLSRRQFFCATKIRANDRKDLEVLSLAAPVTNVINAKTVSSSKKPFEEKAVINRIEYTDRSVWQRDGWTFPTPGAAALSTLKRAASAPACTDF
jgi:hypothetical protein